MEVYEPLKVTEEREDISVAMKLEVYPNRDSLVFRDRWHMTDCETFIRGTIRYKGFSAILAAFNDVGLTSSDDKVPSWVRTLRELTESKLRDAVESRVHPCFEEAVREVVLGMSKEDYVFTKKVLSKADTAHLKTQKDILDMYKGVIKTMRFLGFYDDQTELKTTTTEATTSDGKKQQQQRSYLDVFGDVLGTKLSMSDEDRDLVVMRHSFLIEGQNGVRWNHYSTLIASGSSKK